MTKKTTKKPVNKLIRYFGGKIVSLVLKESKAMGGSPVVRGVLLDVDNLYYYLGEAVEIELAIPINTVTMIKDGDLKDEEEIKPFGDKYQ